MTTADDLLAAASAVLLDFDGPITALMPPPLNAEAAELAREALGNRSLPEAVARTTDHLEVLRYAAEHHPGLAPTVEAACTAAEVECAKTSEPSPEADGLITGGVQRGIPLAVVSNNSTAAVRAFLDRLGWTPHFAAFACREPSSFDRLKPDPYLVIQALARVEQTPERAVFVGDSVSDIVAGHAAGIQVIGLGKTPERADQLADSGADALLVRGLRDQAM